MKRMLLLLVMCLGVVFGSDPATTLAEYGIDVKNAKRAITDCYLANKSVLRPAFELGLELEAAKAAKAGRRFTISPESIMTLEETYDIMSEMCMDTDEGLRFGIQIYSLLGDVDESNPDLKSVSLALDLAKFIQNEFYNTSILFNGEFKLRR